MNGAYISFDEKSKGSIDPGKLADLIVISKDILSLPLGRSGTRWSLDKDGLHARNGDQVTHYRLPGAPVRVGNNLIYEDRRGVSRVFNFTTASEPRSGDTMKPGAVSPGPGVWPFSASFV